MRVKSGDDAPENDRRQLSASVWQGAKHPQNEARLFALHGFLDLTSMLPNLLYTQKIGVFFGVYGIPFGQRAVGVLHFHIGTDVGGGHHDFITLD